MKTLARALPLPAVLVVLAEIGARAHGPSDSNAPPSEVAGALVEALSDGSLFGATRDTLLAAFGGLAISAGVGLALGTLFGSFHALDRVMELPVEVIRPIPSVAVIPIALVALGFGYSLEVAIVAFACVWPLLILTRAAVAGVEPRLIEVARALRLTPLQRTFKIVAPAALPRVFVAFRLAAGISLVVAVTVEIAVNPQGLGYGVMMAGQALRPDLMLAYLVWIGVVGFALNAGLVLAQRRLFGPAAQVEALR
ncbi:MAG TPA: ABC transporter permease [Roseiarcus sp.]|nr:ABC transporter permease [Roseiarcus sp.]